MKYLTLKKMLFLALTAVVLFSSCSLIPNPDPGPEPDPVYGEFYNYPKGRENNNGTLEINNTSPSTVLLFIDSVSPANYIGTVGGLSSIKVKLAEEKFYTIVAVDKDTYEDKKDLASQFSDFTYYSNIQSYSINVSASKISGKGKWIINNNTDYWVSFKTIDQSGVIAVAAPNAKRVTVPVEYGIPYDFIPYFYKERKEKGKVVAVTESSDPGQADTVMTSEEHPIFNTDIKTGVDTDIELPGEDTKPAVRITNNSGKTVRIYVGQHDLLTVGAAGDDFALATGMSQWFTLETGTKVKDINFASVAWEDRKYVTQDMTTQLNKVYLIVLDSDYSTTVDEEDVEDYFQ